MFCYVHTNVVVSGMLLMHGANYKKGADKGALTLHVGQVKIPTNYHHLLRSPKIEEQEKTFFSF